jgi:hypothetical protein
MGKIKQLVIEKQDREAELEQDDSNKEATVKLKEINKILEGET